MINGRDAKTLLIKKIRDELQVLFDRRICLDKELAAIDENIKLTENKLNELLGVYNPVKETQDYLNGIKKINEKRISNKDLLLKMVVEGKEKEAKIFAKICKINFTAFIQELERENNDRDKNKII